MTIDTVANTLLTNLTTELNVTIPDIDLTAEVLQVPAIISDEMYDHVAGPEIADLTTRVIGGTGVFDALMASTKAHLQGEFEKGRITGAEYTKAYVDITQLAMQSAVQFALGKQQAFWQAQQAQVAAISGRVQLEMNKVALAKAKIEAETAEVGYAEAKVQLSLASAQYDAAAYNLSTVLPGQVALTNTQMIGQTDQNAILVYQLATVLPAQVAQTGVQTLLLGSQKSVADAQISLVSEQIEVQRAQTSDTRMDGTTAIAGSVGKQKALYSQQIISYQRDAEVKAAKLFADAWTVQKTVDDGLLAPDGFTNTSLDTVLTVVKTNNGFV